MPEITPYETKKLAQNWKGNNLIVEKYRGNFDRSEVKKHVQSMSDKVGAKYAGRLSVAIYNEDSGQWLSSFRWTRLAKDRVRIPSADDPYDKDEVDDDDDDNIPAFQIFYQKDKPKEGGNSEKNDCLYYALGQPARDKWKFASSFKKVLGLNRNDKISIDKLTEVEECLGNKYAINVTGDHVRTSTLTAKQVIDIKLVNGHYKANTKEHQKVYGVSYVERKPMVWFNPYNKENTIKVYDGETTRYIPFSQFKEIKRNSLSSEWILIHVDNKADADKMEDIYQNWVKVADILKKASDGLINMYKTGSFPKTALKLFADKQRTIKPEHISQDEAIWLMNASSGALVFNRHGYKGSAYKYDITSFYPHMMGNSKFNFMLPIKRGEFKKITQEQFDSEFVKYGIYRCRIEKSNDKDIQKLFRWNCTNYYTNYDLNFAKAHNLKVTMIIDEEPNLLYYSPDKCIRNFEIFGDFVKYLFELKTTGTSEAKSVLNTLWGALCQNNQFTMLLDDELTEQPELPEDSTIGRVVPISDTRTKVEYFKTHKYFETDFARIKPFLLARGRQEVRKYIEPHLDNIIRCHTDGWLSKVPIKYKFGTDLGDMKYEGKCEQLEIVHMKIKGIEFVL